MSEPHQPKSLIRAATNASSGQMGMIGWTGNLAVLRQMTDGTLRKLEIYQQQHALAHVRIAHLQERVKYLGFLS